MIAHVAHKCASTFVPYIEEEGEEILFLKNTPTSTVSPSDLHKKYGGIPNSPPPNHYVVCARVPWLLQYIKLFMTKNLNLQPRLLKKTSPSPTLVLDLQEPLAHC